MIPQRMDDVCIDDDLARRGNRRATFSFAPTPLDRVGSGDPERSNAEREKHRDKGISAGLAALSSTRPPCGPDELLALFGRIDIYVFDQLLRGRITPDMTVLDAGCGGGRNSEYLMRCGAEVFGVDAEPDQVARIRETARTAAPSLPPTNFRTGCLSDLDFADGSFDVVICSAVLHFAEDTPRFERMIREMWRVLGPGGLFFARLASSIGIEDRVDHIRDRWHRLPDGTDRFLVDEPYLLQMTEALGGKLLDPLKTTVVQNMRSMTTWVVGKEGPSPRRRA